MAPGHCPLTQSQVSLLGTAPSFATSWGFKLVMTPSARSYLLAWFHPLHGAGHSLKRAPENKRPFRLPDTADMRWPATGSPRAGNSLAHDHGQPRRSSRLPCGARAVIGCQHLTIIVRIGANKSRVWAVKSFSKGHSVARQPPREEGFRGVQPPGAGMSLAGHAHAP